MDTISSRVLSITALPLITILYIAVTILLTAITSYVRTQSYKSLISSNPELTFDDIIIPALQLVPNKFVFHPWTIWTSAFVETSPFQFLSGLVILYFGLTFLEAQWNPKSVTEAEDPDNNDVNNITQYLNSQQPLSETLKFTSIVIILSNFGCLFIITFIALIRGKMENLSSPFHYGLYILVLPFTAVAKQLTPETNIKMLSLFKFRLKRVPFILLSLSLIISIVRGNLSPFLPAFVSFFTAWFYLRYFQISPAINAFEILPSPGTSSSSTASATRGDPSDTFALVEFFPELVKPYVKPIFDGFYQLSVLLGIVRPWNDEEVDIGNLRSNLRVSGNPNLKHKSLSAPSTTASSDIDERRRQVALKVLEQSVDPST